MAPRSQVLLAFVAFAVPAIAAAEKLETAEFSIQLPDGAERSEQELEGVGPVVLYLHADGEDVVAFSWTDNDALAAPPEQVLEGARAGLLRSTGSALTKDEPVTIEGGGTKWPGRRFQGSSDAKAVEIRATVYLVGKRLYQFVAITPKGADEPAALASMLASFRLRPKAK